MVRRSLFALTLLLVGCGGGGGGQSDDTKDATARLRLFNGSRQANLGLTLNGTDANSLANGADFAGTANYQFVADGAYRLGVATNGGAGTTLTSLEGATFETRQTYGAFAYGVSGEGLLFARLSSVADNPGRSRNAQFVDLLEGPRPNYAYVSRDGARRDSLIFNEPAASGFVDLGVGGDFSTTNRFTLTLTTDGTGATPLAPPLSFEVDPRRPATVVLYGSKSTPRVKVLYGIYTNLPAQQG